MLFDLFINLQKSTILGIGRDFEDALQIAAELQCKSGSLPIYALSMRLSPVRVQNVLYSLMSKFLWDGSDNSRKLHLVDWHSVSMPIVIGGLKLQDWRISMQY